MIYLWISNEPFLKEDIVNGILDKLIERGHHRACLPKVQLGQITEVHDRYESYLINGGESTIGGKLFEKKIQKTLYLGRWKKSATHHIEIADNKVLHGLKNIKQIFEEFL
ncbi:hypothetical protein Acr_15g0017580 [Actinidia rufa]|uniref:Uncharacterized protein n=1 Tax=Actinidia rufa TaxID=165716 RepID=A0A7J0FY90_9ERIC|nr:hypothetical protein Acr_15g0017580 [Actinidia rufa]